MTTSPQSSEVNDDNTCAIGIDVGGTKIAGGVVAFPSGRVLAKRVIPTLPKRGGKPVLDDALDEATGLVVEARRSDLELLGIGVGVAELVDLKGNVTSDHTIVWRGVPVQEMFSQLAPAVVESDVRAGALAEAMFGRGKAYRWFAYITVGTGIASALVLDGQPFVGARGNALVLASSPLTTTCTNCGTVLQPILDDIAAGPALVASYNRKSRGLAAVGEDVTNAAEMGDTIAVEVVKNAAQALGVSVAFLVNVLDPEAVIVGGGLGIAGGLYWSAFVHATREHIWSDMSRDLPILRAALGSDAGFIGAAAAIRQRHDVSAHMS